MNVKKMFDGDKFWNFCGIWEKSISLMMKKALPLTKFLTFCLPVILLFLGGIPVSHECQKSPHKVDGEIFCTFGGPANTLGSDCNFRIKLYFLWFLTFLVISSTHLVVFLFYGMTEKEYMENFTIKWLRFNFILTLALVVLQANVSYMIFI